MLLLLLIILVSSILCSYCPACIDINDHRKEGRRRALYIIPRREQLDARKKEDAIPQLRSYSDLAKIVVISSIPPLYKNRRLSTNEIRRRQIVSTYKNVCTTSSSELDTKVLAKIDEFIKTPSEADKTFQMGYQYGLQKYGSQNGSIPERWEGMVAVATSRRHWSEYFMMLNKSEILFFKGIDAKKVFNRIQVGTIISVRAMIEDEIPIPGFYFYHIETVSRIFYIMLRTERQQKEWVEAFKSLLGEDISISPFDDSRHKKINRSIGLVAEPGPPYLARPSDWHLDKKRVHNYRRIIFNPKGVTDMLKVFATPNELVESILKLAFYLAESETNRNDVYLWVKFLDEISMLQTVRLDDLEELEKASFFLNLYHVMVLHGCLLYGPPPAWNYWNAFFNNFTYIISYEVISIAEVEHNILR